MCVFVGVAMDSEMSMSCSSVGLNFALTNRLCSVGWRRAIKRGEMKWSCA